MQRIIQRTTRLFSKFAAAGASLSMAILFLIVFINSIRRYTIGKSLEWGEELPVYIAIYGVMFAISWAYIQDRHIRFTLLVRFLSESLTRKLYIVVDLIMVATGALLTYSGWMFMLKRGRVEASGIINLAKVNAKWMREFMAYDPLPAIRAASAPLLAITERLGVAPRMPARPVADALADFELAFGQQLACEGGDGNTVTGVAVGVKHLG